MFNWKVENEYGNVVLLRNSKKKVITLNLNTAYYKKWAIIALTLPLLVNYYLVSKHNDLEFDWFLLFMFFPSILFMLYGITLLIKSRQKSQVEFYYKKKKVRFLNSEFSFDEVEHLKVCRTVFYRPGTGNSRDEGYTYQLVLELKNGKQSVLINSDFRNEVFDAGLEISKYTKIKLKAKPF